jgi:hypothetical protein
VRAVKARPPQKWTVQPEWTPAPRLGDSGLVSDSGEQVRQLRQALDSRPDIDLAKGIVMGVRRHSSPETAFRELSTVSQANNVKVRDLARALVELAGGDRGPRDAPRERARQVARATWADDLLRRDDPHRPIDWPVPRERVSTR